MLDNGIDRLHRQNYEVQTEQSTPKSDKTDKGFFSGSQQSQGSNTPSVSELAFGSNNDDENIQDYDYEDYNASVNSGNSASSPQGSTGSATNKSAASPNASAKSTTPSTSAATPKSSANSNFSSGTQSVQPAIISDSASVSELRAGRSDTLTQLREAENQKTNNDAVNAAKENVETQKEAYDNAVLNLESQDEQIQTQIDDIQSRKTENDSAISDQQSTIDEINGNIDSKQLEINDVNSNISSTESQISDIQGQLSSLSAPNKSSYAQTDDKGNTTYPGYDAAYNAYIQKKQELESELEQAKQELSSLENTKSGLENDVTGLQNNLSEAETSLSDLQSQSSSIDSELSALLTEQGSSIEGAQQVLELLQSYNDAQTALTQTEQTETAQIDANISQLRENLQMYDEAVDEREQSTDSLSNAIANNPDKTSEFLFAHCGGEQEAVDALQSWLDDNKYLLNADGTGYTVSVDENHEITIKYGDDEYSTPLSNYFQYNLGSITPYNIIAQNTALKDANAKQNNPTLDVLTSLNNMGTKVEDDVTGKNELVDSIYESQTYQDAYDVISAYCGGNQDCAKKIFDVIFPDYGDKSMTDKSSLKNKSDIVQKLYEVKNGRYVLSKDVLSAMNTQTVTSTQDVPSKIGEFNSELGKYGDFEEIKGQKETVNGTEYYTDADGNICTTQYTCETTSYDDGDYSISYSYTHTNNQTGETYEEAVDIKPKRNENNEIETDKYGRPINEYTVTKGFEKLTLSAEEYAHRYIVEKNYSIDNIPLNEEGNKKIEELYQSIYSQDKNLEGNISEYSKQVDSEGIIDRIHNLNKQLFDAGITHSDIESELIARSGLTQVLLDIENGKDVTSQCEGELDRRLAKAESIQDTYDALTSYYGAEKALEILNNAPIDNDNIKSQFRDYDHVVGSLEFSSYTFGVDANGKVVIESSDSNVGSAWLMQEISKNGNINKLNVETIQKLGIEDLKGPTDVEQTGSSEDKTKLYNQVYGFWTNGGQINDTTISEYKNAAEVYTDFNQTLINANRVEEALAYAQNPQDAFEVFLELSKDTNGEVDTDSAIAQFNQYYSTLFSSEYTDTSVNNGNITGLYAYKDDNDEISYYYTMTPTDAGFAEYAKEMNYQYDEDKNTWYVPYTSYTIDDQYVDYANRELDTCLYKLNYSTEENNTYQKIQYDKFSSENKEQLTKFAGNYADFVLNSYENKKAFVDKYNKLSKEKISVDDLDSNFINQTLLNSDYAFEFSADSINHSYTEAYNNIYGKDAISEMIQNYETDMNTYASNLSRVLSLGTVAASLVCPALSPVAIYLGYTDNAIDLFNMWSNNQKDDYAQWGVNLGMEIATKQAYKYMSNISGDLAMKGVGVGAQHWQAFADSAKAQHFAEYVLEVGIETGLNIGAASIINGGNVDYMDELIQNVIYDSLPYVRAGFLKEGGANWQYDNNGTMFHYDADKGLRYYSDEENSGKISKVTDTNGKLLQTYEYADDGSYVVKAYKNGNIDEPATYVYRDKNDKLISVQKIDTKNGKPIVSQENYDSNGRVKQEIIFEDEQAFGQKDYDVKQGSVIEYEYENNGKNPVSSTETRYVDGKPGIPIQKSYEYNESGQRTKVTINNVDGILNNNRVTIQDYLPTGENIMSTMLIQDGDQYSFKSTNQYTGFPEYKFYSLTEEEYNLLKNSNLTATQQDTFVNLIKSGTDVDTAMKYAELNLCIEDTRDYMDKVNDGVYTEEQQEKIFNLVKEYGLKTKDAICLTEQNIDSAEQEKIIGLITEYKLSAKNAIKISELGIEDKGEISKLSNILLDFHFPNIDIEKADEVLKLGLDADVENEVIITINYNSNISVETAVNIVNGKYEDEIRLSLLNICQKYPDLDFSIAEEVANKKLTEKMCEKTIDAINKYGINVDAAVNLASENLSPEMEQEVVDFYQKNSISIADSTKIIKSNLTEEEQQKVVDMIKEGINSTSAIDILHGKITKEEYLQAYDYYKDLTDVNGNKIFTSEEILSYMSRINPGSVEASNMEMLTELVQQGVVGKQVFDSIPQMGKLTDSVIDDIDRLYAAYSEGYAVEDAMVPKFTDSQEALDAISKGCYYLGGSKIPLQTGDVLEIDGEDKIYVVNEDGSTSQLNMSKEAYMKLFPPVERFATTQNRIGNCWEITALNALMTDPQTRHYVYDCFSQEGNDIIVTFPESGFSQRFKNGALPSGTNTKFLSKGALGIQMMEYTDGRVIQQEKIKEVVDEYTKRLSSQAYSDEGKQEIAQKLQQFTEDLARLGDKAEIVDTGLFYIVREYNSDEFDTVYEGLRNGGHSSNLFKRLGMEEAQTYSFNNYDNEQGKVESILQDVDYFKTHVIAFNTMGSDEDVLNEELGIVSRHAYLLMPGKINSDGTIATYTLRNPWGNFYVELTYEQLIKYGGSLSVAKK